MKKILSIFGILLFSTGFSPEEITKTTQIKKALTFLLFLSLFFVSSLFAETAQEKGKRIMEGADRLPVIEKMMTQTVLKIYDKRGKKLFIKKSRMASFVADFRDYKKRLSRSICYFYSPSSDKGNGSLMIEHDNKDNDQWVYLKGLRKPKKIVGSGKSSSFMGSDFSNGDICSRYNNDYNYKWLGTEKIIFKKKRLKVEKIEAVFKDKQKRKDYGYSKSVIWINIKSGLIFKMELYNLRGQLRKKSRLLAFSVKKNRDRKKVYVPTNIEMKSVLKGTKTIMMIPFRSLRVEKAARKVKPGIFKVNYLTRRWW